MTIELSTFGYFNPEKQEYEHFSMKNMKEFADSILTAIFKHSNRESLEQITGSNSTAESY